MAVLSLRVSLVIPLAVMVIIWGLKDVRVTPEPSYSRISTGVTDPGTEL